MMKCLMKDVDVGDGDDDDDPIGIWKLKHYIQIV